MTQKTEYTFTFDCGEEAKFRRVLSRLDEDEFNILSPIMPKTAERGSDLSTVMEMDAEAALTFRLGMKFLKIERKRSEEEEAERQAQEDRHTVTITVKVDDLNGPPKP